MSEYATIEHYANHVIDEITKRDVEQVSERLRALGWEEVVRCRDCKYLCDDGSIWGCGWHCSCLSTNDGTPPDGFCAWGERRKDEQMR